MSKAVTQKVCAIFGYGPGVGAACARHWSANDEYQVAVLARNQEKLQKAEQEIPNCKGFVCDVTQPSSIESAISSIQKEFGGDSYIETVIYNAGNGVWDTFDKIDLEKFDLSLKTNVHGLLKVAQLVTPQMIEKNRGNIVVTGATASLRGKPFTAGFAPAKGAQRLLAQSLARDLGPKNVHVSYVIIDGGIGSADNPKTIDPAAIAETYWNLAQQPKSCWTFECDIRPNVETW